MSQAEQRVQQLVDELEGLLSRDGAVLRCEDVDGGQVMLALAGNRAGYLRLGMELLKVGLAAVDESRPLPRAAAETINATLSPDSATEIVAVERTESTAAISVIPYARGPRLSGGWLTMAGCLVVVFAALLLMAFGAVSLFHQLRMLMR